MKSQARCAKKTKDTEWLKVSLINGREKLKFELTSMDANLIDVLDLMIEYVSLRNGTIMVDIDERGIIEYCQKAMTREVRGTRA